MFSVQPPSLALHLCVSSVQQPEFLLVLGGHQWCQHTPDSRDWRESDLKNA